MGKQFLAVTGFLSLAVMVLACATPYQAKGLRGGYDDYPAGAGGVIMVTFQGNGYTSETDVLKMWHRRAGEVCGGSDRYVVLDSERSTSVTEGDSTSSTNITFNGNQAYATTTTSPGMRWEKHKLIGLIRCVGDRPSAKAEECAESSSASACFEVGFAHDKAKEFARARGPYERACAKGSARGCVNLGLLLDSGDIPKEKPLAASYFEKGCELHDEQGCAWAAYATYTGYIDAPNHQEGARLLAASCERDGKEACGMLGRLTQNRSALERGCHLGDNGSCKALSEQPRDRVTRSAPNLPAEPLLVRDGMALLPSGMFAMGSDEGDPDHRPVHRVEVRAFWIDRTEVTVAAYERCVSAHKCSINVTTAPEGATLSKLCNWGNAAKKDHPINCVDRDDASAFCRHLGKRLPSEEEWEYAARGPGSRAFPWGDQAPQNQLCWARTEPLQGTCAVGTFPAGTFGLVDMAGNVHEWTSSTYSQSYSEAPSGLLGVIRGGGWADTRPSLVRPFGRFQQPANFRSPNVGFRCVRDSQEVAGEPAARSNSGRVPMQDTGY